MKKTVFFFLVTAICLAQEKKIDPKKTEVWEPQPPKVTPGKNNSAPSDAIILFDGSNFNQWTGKGKTVNWTLKLDGSMTVKPKAGGIKTKQDFGSMQLHIEWKSPINILNKKGQQRGNSGIFLQGRYEIQVLDNNNNKTYANGQVGSVYKQSIPLAMASVPTGEWNSYDIIYHQPKFDKNGAVVKKATVTVLHNNVLIQDNVTIEGPTVYRGKPSYKAHEKGPIYLQDHGNLVSYRNIWVRELKE
ncbi:3-keto-disaccharide hydrolase [Wenyingzhuangia sp. IMCC45574]